MPSINLSEQDHNDLMQLLSELHTQETDSQANPRFWHPVSRTLVQGDSTDTPYLINESGDIVTAREYLDDQDCWNVWEGYLSFSLEQANSVEEVEEDFIRWLNLSNNLNDGYRVDYLKEADTQHVNPSFFKSDVQWFIKRNKHHLGTEPRTYARTIQGMSNMQRLFGILMSINP
jgi:hypothetical protein